MNKIIFLTKFCTLSFSLFFILPCLYGYDELPLGKARFLSTAEHGTHLSRLRSEQTMKNERNSDSGSPTIIMNTSTNSSVGSINKLDLEIGNESKNISIDIDSYTEGLSNQKAKISNKSNS